MGHHSFDGLDAMCPPLLPLIQSRLVRLTANFNEVVRTHTALADLSCSLCVAQEYRLSYACSMFTDSGAL